MSRRSLASLGSIVLATSGGLTHAAPVPDYAPVAAVVVHAQLEDVAGAFVDDLKAVLGSRLVIERYDPGEWVDEQLEDDGTLMWMRDYAPIYRRDANGTLTGLRYEASNPNRAAYQASESAPLRLIHENGNLVVAGRWVFVGDRIFDDNAKLSRTEVLQRLADGLGHDLDHIVVLPRLPGEATGHVDLFLLPLNDKTVLIPSISDDAVAERRSDAEQVVGNSARVFLERTASQVAALGLKVVRVPMLAPFIWRSPDDGASDVVYFSPANALLANLGERRVVWLPKVDGTVLWPSDRLRQRRYLRVTWRALRDAGWSPRVVDATELGRYLGLFRCVTAPIPHP